jgi:hypothetical protein
VYVFVCTYDPVMNLRYRLTLDVDARISKMAAQGLKTYRN